MDGDELALEERKHLLEIWKLVISTITAVILVILTFVVNNVLQERSAVLKRQEQVLAEKQRVYAELGAKLNIFYVYAMDVGDFRNYEPPRVVQLKREADREFFTYLPFWTKATEARYADFMKATFRTYNGAGKTAMIRARRKQKVAAYDVDKMNWKSEWDSYFTEEIDPGIQEKYDALIHSLISDIVSTTIREF